MISSMGSSCSMISSMGSSCRRGSPWVGIGGNDILRREVVVDLLDQRLRWRSRSGREWLHDGRRRLLFISDTSDDMMDDLSEQEGSVHGAKEVGRKGRSSFDGYQMTREAVIVIAHFSKETMEATRSNLISKHTKRKRTGRRARDDEPHKHTRAVLVPFGATMDAAIDAALHMAAAELRGQQVELNEAAEAGVRAEWGEHFDFVGYTRDLRARIVGVMRELRVELPQQPAM